MASLLRCQPYAQSCQDSQRHICHISKWHHSFGVNPTPNLVRIPSVTSAASRNGITPSVSTRRPILSGFPASHLPHLEMAPLLRCQPYAQSCQDSRRHICHISKWHHSFGVNPTPNLVRIPSVTSATSRNGITPSVSTLRLILSGFPASHLPHLEMASLLRCQPDAQSCQDSQRHICHISKSHHSFGVNPTPNLVRIPSVTSATSRNGTNPSVSTLRPILFHPGIHTVGDVCTLVEAELFQHGVLCGSSRHQDWQRVQEEQKVSADFEIVCGLTSATSACFSISFCSGSFSTR